VSLLELSAVDVAYGDLPALRGVNVVVEAGETLSVVGANGAGKTTMLRTISGLLRPRRGEVRFEGERIDRLPCHRVVELGVRLLILFFLHDRNGIRSRCQASLTPAPTRSSSRHVQASMPSFSCIFVA
jgi:ABC-type cobalamin/Fe3+-siderophores transport system ATPase subunit